jgi:hypothetical protein
MGLLISPLDRLPPLGCPIHRGPSRWVGRTPLVAAPSGRFQTYRKAAALASQVGPGDTLFVEDAFPDTAPPTRYPTPADLARHITQILFTA